jgi:putative ABC transport system substrate-binding protein
MKHTLSQLVQFGLILFLSLTLAACKSNSDEKKIGIILPIEHQSLNEIVAGFKETLSKETNLPIQIKVSNAQGDINLQRAIIQQMKDQQYDLIVPIGLSTTEAAIAMTREQPILSLASSLTEEDRQKQKPCHLAVVQDEISPQKILAFIHAAYPKLSRLVLIHSTQEKIFPDVKKAVIAGQTLGIAVKPMIVNTLQDLYSVTQAIPANIQGILILKDNLIVSGITTLTQLADKRNIPLITSDQGSVENGAAFALGMPERKIGEEGAKLAALILAGRPACGLPIVEVADLTVFINPSAMSKERQAIQIVEAAAKQNNYQTQLIQNQNSE